MPFVKTHRENGFSDAARSYQIFVDGEKKAEIRRASTVEFFVPVGFHRIFLKLDWCGSNEIEFNIKTEETIEFDCGNNTKIFLELYYVLFAPKDYLWLKKRS